MLTTPPAAHPEEGEMNASSLPWDVHERRLGDFMVKGPDLRQLDLQRVDQGSRSRMHAEVRLRAVGP